MPTTIVASGLIQKGELKLLLSNAPQTERYFVLEMGDSAAPTYTAKAGYINIGDDTPLPTTVVYVPAIDIPAWYNRQYFECPAGYNSIRLFYPKNGGFGEITAWRVYEFT